MDEHIVVSVLFLDPQMSIIFEGLVIMRIYRLLYSNYSLDYVRRVQCECFLCNEKMMV